MELIDLREYFLALPCAEETTPFDEDTLVYKICGKMFAMSSISDQSRITVKCDPELALELREQYPEITPGYHMSKIHWNTIRLDGDLPESFIKQQVANSYLLVVDKLPKAQCAELEPFIQGFISHP